MEEIWKDVKGYEGLYKINNFGIVKNSKKKIIKSQKNKSGYITIKLHNNGKRKKYMVHRLVAETFIPDKIKFKYFNEEDKLKYTNHLEKLCLNHIDENKLNNNVENLEWCTYLYNNNYGTRKIRVKNSLKKVQMTEERLKIIRETHWKKKIFQYDLDGNLIRKWDSIKEASIFIKKDITGIQHCCKGKLKTCGGYIWKYAEEVK